MKSICELFSTQDLCKVFNVSSRTWARWDALRKGPPKIKVGKKNFYRVEAVEAWLAANETPPLAKSTSGRKGV
jgi:hypothetical protein